MILYNHATGCPKTYVTDDDGNTVRVTFPWTFNPNGTPSSKWTFTDNDQSYVTHVVEDEWESGLPKSE